jgi:hypothetical protein
MVESLIVVLVVLWALGFVMALGALDEHHTGAAILLFFTWPLLAVGALVALLVRLDMEGR